MTVRGHQLAIDWSQQGVWTNALEDVSSYVLPGEISIAWGRSIQAQGVTLASTSGQLEFALTNEAQLFSPENSSSPIAGKILPNRPARYQVTNPATGATTVLIAGVLDSYDVDGDPASEFTGTVLDGWGRPGDEKLSTALYSGLRTGDAVGIVLDSIGWTGPREIDPGATYMPWWWAEGDDASAAITKLVNSEGAPAVAYVRGGTFVFRDRHHRLLDARSTTSQGTYTHLVPAAPGSDFKIERGSFRYNHGAANIVNSATFTVDVRAPQPLAEVWTSEDPLTVGAGETVQVVIQSSDPFTSAIAPTAEAGDIITQSGSVTSATLSRTSGQAAILTITCATATVITRVAVRAQPVSVVRTVQVSARDASSIGIFGLQEWPSDAEPVWANRYDAAAIARRIVAVYANYRPTIELTVVALTPTYLTEMLDARISDRITVTNQKRGINADYVIERLEHRITSLGLVHRLTITCQAAEPVQPAALLTFDVAGRGFNDGRFGVDGIDNAGSVFQFDVAGHGFNDGVFAT